MSLEEVEENISIILPFEDRITENEISISNLSDNSITSNIFVVEYALELEENAEIYSCFVNQDGELISTIDKILLKSKKVSNVKMQFELLPNAENGNVLFKVYSKEQKLLYEEIYFIDRAFTFDDDFGLF